MAGGQGTTPPLMFTLTEHRLTPQQKQGFGSFTSPCQHLPSSLLPPHPPSSPRASPCLDLLPARHRVPHAGPAERINVFHDDERSFLQRHDGQVVILPGRCSSVQLVARPHMVLHGQRAVLPLTHLMKKKQKKKTQVFVIVFV